MISPLSISQSDMHLLRTLFVHDDAVSPLDIAEREILAKKLEEAVVIPDDAPPDPPVAGLHDLVSVQDLSTSPPDRFDFTLVLPHEANFEDDHISVLSPLGTAVFGRSAGERVSMTCPSGPRQLRVLAVCKKMAIH